MQKQFIVTHQNPDLDAIGSIWLLKRFDKKNYLDANITFVPAGKQISKKQLNDLKVSIQEVTHIDTGGGKFDHHNEKDTLKSATRLVFNFLKSKHVHLAGDTALEKIVTFINKTDQFNSYFFPDPTNNRYNFMLEEILFGYKMGSHGDDHDVVDLGLMCLDGIYTKIKLVEEARLEIKNKATIFKTKFGKAIGLLSSNNSVIKLGQKLGYNIVIRKDQDKGNVRIKAAPLPEIDLTSLYKEIKQIDNIGTWYFHPGKHMLINGSRKHLGQKPSPLKLEKIIEIIKKI